MKLFVTDYDDTLYQNDISIEKNIKKIKELQERNFVIMISTGRSYPSIKEQVNKYIIPYDYLSCADGSIIYDNKGNVIYQSNLDPVVIERIKKYYQDLPYDEIQFSYPEGYFNYLKESNLLGINVCISTRLCTKKMVDEFMNIKEEYPDYNYLYYAHPNYSYLCIKPSDVSKSFAIKVLIDKLKIKKENVFVIGDSGNDIEMIRDYHGVGMTNSCQEILNITKKQYNELSDYVNDILEM